MHLKLLQWKETENLTWVSYTYNICDHFRNFHSCFFEWIHPELFENVPLSEEVTEPDFISIDNELTDDELIESMQQYEVEMKAAFDSYDYLLENEVSAILLH